MLDKVKWDMFGGFKYSLVVKPMKEKKPILTVAVIRGLVASTNVALLSEAYKNIPAGPRSDIRRAAQWSQAMHDYRIVRGKKL